MSSQSIIGAEFQSLLSELSAVGNQDRPRFSKRGSEWSLRIGFHTTLWNLYFCLAPKLHCGILSLEDQVIYPHSIMPMKDSHSEGDDLLKNSSLYKEFQAEREELLKHKWIESEKAGYEIGFERALTNWFIKRRSKWRKSNASRQSSDKDIDVEIYLNDNSESRSRDQILKATGSLMTALAKVVKLKL